MVEYQSELHRISHSIASLEEEHNSVVDAQGHLTQQISDIDMSITEEVTRIKHDISHLRKEIHARIQKAKRATVLISLLAQQEELKPMRARAEKQPYEFYAKSSWFKSALQNSSSSSKSDS